MKRRPGMFAEAGVEIGSDCDPSDGALEWVRNESAVLDFGTLDGTKDESSE